MENLPLGPGRSGATVARARPEPRAEACDVMRPITQIIVGMAAAGVAAGPQRPFALVAGAVAGVLPDVIDWWWCSYFRQPDIIVTPDPLAPTPAILVEGVRAALQQVRACGTSCVVRFNPLPAPDIGFAAYHFDYDRQHQLSVTLESNGKLTPVNAPGTDGRMTAILLPHHPLPLRITHAPVDLQLRASGTRIESRDLAGVTSLGHGLPVAAVLAMAALVINFWLGVATAAALATHLLLENGGRRELAPWLPFSTHTWRSRRLWNEGGWRANLCACIFAGAVLAALFFTGR